VSLSFLDYVVSSSVSGPFYTIFGSLRFDLYWIDAMLIVVGETAKCHIG
jgi:hypothetical protein